MSDIVIVTVKGHHLAARIDRAAGAIRGLKDDPYYLHALQDISEMESWNCVLARPVHGKTMVVIPDKTLMWDVFKRHGLSRPSVDVEEVER